MSKQLTAAEMHRIIRPFLPCLSRLVLDAGESCVEAIAVLGQPRRTERAGDMHRATRTKVRAWCDLVGGEMFELNEEREGRGLDSLVCRVQPQTPFALRFGRLRERGVRRNDTIRSHEAREHGQLSSDLLFGEMEDVANNDALSHVSLTYEIEDGDTPTIGGAAAWWISRTVFGQEKYDGFDQLEIVDRNSPPANLLDDVRRVEAAPNPQELAAWRRLWKRAKSA